MVQLPVEDVSMEREIYKGRGNWLHAAKTSGKIVAMKVYQGNRAREVSFTKINSTYQHIHSDYFRWSAARRTPDSFRRLCMLATFILMIWNWRFGYQSSKSLSNDWSFPSQIRPFLPYFWWRSVEKRLELSVYWVWFGTEYEGAVHDILGQALEKDLKKVLILGLQTVCNLL